MKEGRLESCGLVAAVAIFLLALLPGLFIHPDRDFSWPEGKLECTICLSPGKTKSLITGYNYHLVQSMAKDLGIDLSVTLSQDTSQAIDSLLAGSVGLVIIPSRDIPETEGILQIHSLDNISTWILPQAQEDELRAVGEWFEEYHGSEHFHSTRDTYMKVYSPYKSRQRKQLSPYDDIIRQQADSIGWDWRLLAAIIYQESRFHIEAQSPRGAAGLMQMMPSTAHKLGVDDLVDPEQSILAGARLLQRLTDKYTCICDSDTECRKYALAAYNAGHGRIRDCINLGRLRGIDLSRWENTAGIIPEMRDSSILEVDTVKLGVFKGHETIAYVDKVLSLYAEFCRIIPE